MGNSSMLERRLEAIATKRERKVRVVGHSLGGMLARGLAVRRPDLVSGIITMGSPMLAPGTSHPVLLTAAEVLVRLSRAGVPGLMNASCVAGDCARLAWEGACAASGWRKVRGGGHGLGGGLARGLAVRRPYLGSGISTMGSPMLAPGTSHPVLLTAAEVLVRLSRAGVPGLMNESCVAGDCARLAWEESRQPMPEGVGFTCIWSHGDGLVDPLACVDPASRRSEEHTSALQSLMRIPDAVFCLK